MEVLDLRHFPAAALRPLIDHECREWSTRLHWDYKNSADLLLSYIDAHTLPGYVAVENGKPCGYVFCVYEGTKAIIGDAYASVPEDFTHMAARDIERRLLTHQIETLQNSPGVSRIETQMLLHPAGTHARLFADAGFNVFKRLLLEHDLTRPAPSAAPAPISPALESLHRRRWEDADFARAASLIHAAYRGNVDARINDQYRSVSGAQRFLHNIVRFPGCGFFDPSASRVASEDNPRELAGMLLCSRVRSDIAHITQLCTAPSFRRHGLATALLDDTEAFLRRERFSALTLTVTEANENAVTLYYKRGFTLLHSFEAMVWESTGGSAPSTS